MESNMSKKILILANNSIGLYKFRVDLIKKLIIDNNEVVLSTPDNGFIDDFQKIGCKVHLTDVDRRGINPITDLKLYKKYINLIDEEKPDLVITYTIKPNIYGGMFCRRKKVPYAINITGLGTAFQKDNLLKKLVIKLYKTALKKAKVVFFENQGNKEIFVKEKIIDDNKCKVLNGAGVNLDYYSVQEYPKNNEVTRFLFIGRVMKEKGIDELFAVMRRLYSENYNCVLDVVGISEEDYHDEIDKGIKEGWLCFHGYQEDVRPFIREANCFVLPSWHEGMANTNLENASSGRPVITSNIFGCKESVIDGVSGLLCEPKNVDSLYSAMVKFLNTDNDDRIKMGLEGRKHMEEIFSKEKIVTVTCKCLLND